MKALIIDDDPSWHTLLARVLAQQVGQVECVPVEDPSSAEKHIRDTLFDLILVDLHLTQKGGSGEDTEAGMRLLERIAESPGNQWCARIVLTAYGETSLARRALRQLGVHDFLEKDKFDPDAFVRTVQSALCEAMIKRAEILRQNKYLLTLFFSDAHLLLLELRGPDRQLDYLPSDPVRFDATDLGRRCDELNIWLSPPLRHDYRERWRAEARSIGKGLYSDLAREPTFIAGLSSARNLPQHGRDLWLCMRGPRASLDVPLELLYDGWEYLALAHPVYRRVIAGPIGSRKVDPFRHVFSRFVQKGKLRILLIASNVGTRIDAVDREVDAVSGFLQVRLGQLGIEHELEVCHSTDATYEHVQDMLHNSHYHIIHYAGHGRFDDQIAERSCLFFREGTSLKAMPASTLKTLLQESETQLIYLSCCLGARTAEGIGQGDFLGLVDSIAQADVPTILGHRWVVSDKGAKDLALSFYETLFSTLSPEDALFEARCALSTTRGRDDETWASPVLVVQNS